MNDTILDKEKIQKKIGSNIEYWRKQKELTQQELASILGVSNRTISNYENGLGIDAVLLHALSKILECEVDDFFMGL